MSERIYSPPQIVVWLIAFILAASGLFYSVIMLWFIPVFWPGYLVWIGWITIAFGYQWFNNPKFWILSAVWNAIIMFPLFFNTDWTFSNMAPGYIHCRMHSVVAFFLSIVAFSLPNVANDCNLDDQ